MVIVQPRAIVFVLGLFLVACVAVPKPQEPTLSEELGVIDVELLENIEKMTQCIPTPPMDREDWYKGHAYEDRDKGCL